MNPWSKKNKKGSTQSPLIPLDEKPKKREFPPKVLELLYFVALIGVIDVILFSLPRVQDFMIDLYQNHWAQFVIVHVLIIGCVILATAGKKSWARVFMTVVGIALVISVLSTWPYFNQPAERVAETSTEANAALSAQEPVTPSLDCSEMRGRSGYCSGSVTVYPGGGPVYVSVPGGHCIQWPVYYNDLVDARTGVPEKLVALDTTKVASNGSTLELTLKSSVEVSVDVSFEIDRLNSELCRDRAKQD